MVFEIFGEFFNNFNIVGFEGAGLLVAGIIFSIASAISDNLMIRLKVMLTLGISCMVLLFASIGAISNTLIIFNIGVTFIIAMKILEGKDDG